MLQMSLPFTSLHCSIWSTRSTFCSVVFRLSAHTVLALAHLQQHTEAIVSLSNISVNCRHDSEVSYRQKYSQRSSHGVNSISRGSALADALLHALLPPWLGEAVVPSAFTSPQSSLYLLSRHPPSTRPHPSSNCAALDFGIIYGHRICTNIRLLSIPPSTMARKKDPRPTLFRAISPRYFAA